MGKKVTYGIEYAVTSNIGEVYKEHIDKYTTLLAEGRSINAAQTVVELTELLLDESDSLDDPEDPEILQYLSAVTEYCTKVIKLLEDRQENELLPRAHNNIGQCYLK